MKKIQTLAAAFGLICAAAMAAAPAAAADMASFKVQKHHEKVIKDCTFCHTQENAVAGNAFVVPDDKQCMSCHGTYEALAKKTDKLDEPNPHRSHHYSTRISCTACHKEHSKPAAYCNECHEFKYKLP